MTLVSRQWELDHIFFACPEPGMPSRTLTDAGLSLSEGRVHRGQGTRNVYAHFDNAFFELILPNNEAELRSEAVSALGLRERIFWQETGACPFGICLRPSGEPASLPLLETWPYSPAYLPEGESVPIVTPRGNIGEPLVFISPHRHPSQGGDAHFGSRRSLTQVVIQHPPVHRPSATIALCAKHAPFAFIDGPGFHMELVLDGGQTGERRDLAPLPLSVRY